MALGGLTVIGRTDGGNINMKCKDCLVELTSDNAAKKNADHYRNQCKKCRSKAVMKYAIGNPKRQAYAREYIRRIGKVKQYPCETCSALCYKKYAHAFCSDKCRFMFYVEKSDKCWIWNGAKNKSGYGRFSMQGNPYAIASRASYELFKGQIKAKAFVCHLCDIPSCVNPEHLWIGNHVENMKDMTRKGRQHRKLTAKDAIGIRRSWKRGASNASLCEQFKITCGTVSSIVNRRIWKHI